MSNLIKARRHFRDCDGEFYWHDRKAPFLPAMFPGGRKDDTNLVESGLLINRFSYTQLYVSIHNITCPVIWPNITAVTGRL